MKYMKGPSLEIIHWSMVADDLSPMCWEEDHHADKGQFLIETNISKVTCAACRAHYRTLNDLKLAEAACEYCMKIAEGGVVAEQRSEAVQTVLDGGHFKGCAEYAASVGESPAPATRLGQFNGTTFSDTGTERVAAPPEPATEQGTTKRDPGYWVHDQTFYELMQHYRHAPIASQKEVVSAFGDVQQLIQREVGKESVALQAKVSTLEQALRTIRDDGMDARMCMITAKNALSGESRQ